MPPRYTYWTILAGGLPTSFRAAAPEDLLPTLRRLKERHPDAEMKWFARGKLWSSPEAQREASQPTSTPRGRDWRPGGEHKDPREKFKVAKQVRNLVRRGQRFQRKHDAQPDSPVTEPRHPPDRSRTVPGGTAQAQRSSHSRPSRSLEGTSGAQERDWRSRSPAKKPGGPGRAAGPSRGPRRAPARPPKGRGRGR
jgi:hypothetical protein